MTLATQVVVAAAVTATVLVAVAAMAAFKQWLNPEPESPQGKSALASSNYRSCDGRVCRPEQCEWAAVEPEDFH